MAKVESQDIGFDEINESVQQYSRHPFLWSSHVRLTASRFHFEVARTIMQAADVDDKSVWNVLEAVLLLQQGLSIHDDVDDVEQLRRQLYVLTGDYCSSQYYWVLARTRNPNLLVDLCEAVVHINEAKMAFFKLPPKDLADRYMELQETIEGELLYALARHYLVDANASMPHIRALVRAHVVKQEMARRQTPKNFTMRQACDWLADATQRFLHVQTNTVLQPISAFIMDYLNPTQSLVQTQALAEGNH